MQPITRRGFLIHSALAGAALALGGLGSAAPSLPAAHGASPASPLVVAHGRDYAGLLVRAVARLGGPRLLGRPGETVLIKPTLAWRRSPGQGANVHPAVLRAVIELALAGGARRVVVAERTSMDSATVFRANGAWQAVRAIGDPRVELVHLDEAAFVPFAELNVARAELSGAQAISLDGYLVCRHLLEANRVINLAAARQHPTRQVALGMANLLGLIGGGPADVAWRQRQGAELALLSAAVRPELTILDATRAVVRNGPLGNGPADVARWDTLALSVDPLAVEAFGAARFGLDPAQLEHLALAEELGLGRASVSGRRLIELEEDDDA